MIEREYHLIKDAATLIGCSVVDLIHLGAVGKLNIWTKVTSDVSGLCISREKAGRRISDGKIPVELLPKGPGLALLTKTFLSSLEGNNPGDVQVYLGTENEYLAVMPLEGHNEFFFVLTCDINRLRSTQDAHQKESGKDRDERNSRRANESLQMKMLHGVDRNRIIGAFPPPRGVSPERWSKRLGDPSNKMKSARVSNGGRGGISALWNPAKFAMWYAEEGHMTKPNLTTIIRRDFPDFLTEWEIYTASFD